MSNYKFNSEIEKLLIQNQKKQEETRKANPDSLLLAFEKELRGLGYNFEILEQVKHFLPKHKNVIVPLALDFYKKAKVEKDKRYFLSLFHYKGMDECIPSLLEDIYSGNSSVQLKAIIAETLRAIHASKYIDDYINILSMKTLEDARNPIISLIGDYRVEKAIPLLIDALDEGKNITTNAIEALGKYKKEELRGYFEKYISHKNKYYRKEAEKALQKLEKTPGKV